jgi:hypothetical protein
MGMTFGVILGMQEPLRVIIAKNHSSNPGTLLGTLGTLSFPLFQSTNDKDLTKWGK